MRQEISPRWRDRVRVYPLLMAVAYVVVFAGFILFRQGFDPYAPEPRDFMAFWLVADLAHEGQLAEAYDPAVLRGLLAEYNKPGINLPWFYPPHMSIVTAWFPGLPYWAAYLGHVALGLLAFVLGLRLLPLQAMVWRVAVLAPVLFLNVLFGQVGALVAGMMLAGLAAMPGRWLMAGLAFGALTIKPQFGLLIPVVVLACGAWRVFGVAAVSAVALAVVSVALFGAEAWSAFVAAGIAEASGAAATGALKITLTAAPSAGLILIGLPGPVALAVQGAVVLGLAAFLVWLVRKGVAQDQLVAVTMVAALLAAPHSIVYDWVLLVPPLAITLQAGLDRGFLKYEPAVLVAVWLAPFLILITQDAELPIAPLLVLAFFAVVARRAAISVSAPR